MRKVVRLTERDIQRIVKGVLNERHTKSKYRILNEAYLPAVQEGDEECDIVCERKHAKYGSNGSLVQRIQHGLSRCGFNVKSEGGGMMPGCKDDPNKCDGLFRGETKKAVEEFQRKHGLSVDGVVGKETINKLNETNCMAFKDCDCETQNDDDSSPIPGQKIDYDKYDCDELKRCLNSMGTDWCMNDLEKCLKGKKPPVKSPRKQQCERCPATIDCMPKYGATPLTKLPCKDPFIIQCIESGCTKIAY